MDRCSSRTSTTVRSIASHTAHRLPAGSNSLNCAISRWWRQLAIGLAAAAFWVGCGFAQDMPLAERIAQCGACHGEDGNSRMPNVPSLAGQPEFFVLNQLFLMREGVRRIEVMMALVKDLKDDDLQGLAKHFAALTPKASDEPIDPALVQRGAEMEMRSRCG